MTLQNVLGDIIGCGRVSDRQWIQATLPLRIGGLGIKDPLNTVSAARLSAIFSYLSRGRSFGLPEDLLLSPPDLRSHLLHAQTWLGDNFEPVQGWLNGGAPAIEVDHSRQHWWASKIALAIWKALPDGASLRDKCRLVLQSMPHATAWLSTPPSRPFQEVLSGPQVRLLLRWWLGYQLVPGHQPVACPNCGQAADVFGDHWICCSRSAITKRHHHVRDTIASLIREQGFSAFTEVSIGARDRPADVAIQGFEARPVAVDFTISHPLQPSQSRNPEEMKKHLLLREERKCNKYLASTARAGWVFTPASFHAWSGQGPMCAAFMEKLVRRAVGDLHGKARGAKIASFWQRISLAVMKGVAEQLSAALHVQVSSEEGSFAPGPVTLMKTDGPLIDDFGNLLPDALPAPPPMEGWDTEEGPLQPFERRIGCLRIRVRSPSNPSNPEP